MRNNDDNRSKRDRSTANDRPDTERSYNNRTTTPDHRPPVTEMKPGQPSGSDEAGDVSVQNADNPMLVREDVKNTSDSSGLHAADEAKGEKLKDQLRRGGREAQPMD
jgi:hypothetical protein